MADGLCERDFPAWSGRRAGLLRRLAAGERVDNAVDWSNPVEKVENPDRPELRACESLRQQALLHVMKLHAWPGGTGTGHRHAGAAAFLGDARRCFAPSMRQPMHLDQTYADAPHVARTVTDESGPPRPLPAACPSTLDDLPARHPDVSAPAARFGQPPGNAWQPAP